MSAYWLGVDVGTGGSRAILLDANGKEAAAVSVPHEEIVMEQPLWAEQRPDNWAEAAFEAIRGALAAAEITGDQVRGVGLSGQMHGLVILDRDQQVIRPALIWCDQRSQSQVDWINRHLGARGGTRSYGESGADWIYLAEIAVGARSRAATIRACAACSAAQGLRSFSTDG